MDKTCPVNFKLPKFQYTGPGTHTKYKYNMYHNGLEITCLFDYKSIVNNKNEPFFASHCYYSTHEYSMAIFEAKMVWRTPSYSRLYEEKKRFTYYFKVGYSVPNYTIIVSISFSSLKEGVKEFSDFFLPSSFQEIPDLYYYNRATRRPDLQLFVCLCLLKNRYFVVACLFV